MEKSSKSRPRLPSSWQELKSNPRRLRIAAAIVAAAIVALVLLVILIVSGGNDSSSAPQATAPAPAAEKSVVVVPESDLLAALKGTGYPVYWAGPRIGVEYEVQRLPEGRTYVRYLPKGEEAGSDKGRLTIGSYQQPEALASLRKIGQQGAILVKIARGGYAYADGPQATSAYMAFPGLDLQVEVYDPAPGRALWLIRSGAVVPIGG